MNSQKSGDMVKLTKEAQQLMIERFGHDNVIALATIDDGIPHVRYVNALYEKGAFYVVTYTLSNKMKHIEKNPTVAICGDWFTANGIGKNMGYILDKKNEELAGKLRTAFAKWYFNGHTNEADPYTCILCIDLTDGVLLSHGTRYELDFTNGNFE